MKRILLVACAALALATAISAQVALTVTKSGSDVVLTWTGGTGPYTIVKSRHPSMTVRAKLVGTTSGTALTDTGAASVLPKLIFYVVSDSTGPSVTITSISPNFSTAHPALCAAGTASSGDSTVTAVYCNSILAQGTTTWTTCSTGHYGVPVSVPFDPLFGHLPIQAAAVDAFGNWGFTFLHGSYTGVLGSRDIVIPRGVGR